MAALKQNEHIKTQNFLTQLQFLFCVTGNETGMFTLYPSRNASHRYLDKLSHKHIIILYAYELSKQFMNLYFLKLEFLFIVLL